MNMSDTSINPTSLTRFAWLSIAAAVLTIGLKFTAYLLTGSIGLFSDAIESIVNLLGALMALVMLTIAAKPQDENHAFGHHKAEYFSSGFEGALILLAAISIGITAVNRLLNPQPLEQLGFGLAVSLGASLINLGVALVLKKAGKRYESITLQADSKHLMTDVWTSAGVLIAIGAVALTGWQQLDPIIALAVAANIVWTGFHIIRSSALGLMDSAISVDEIKKITDILDINILEPVKYHAIRTRQSGSQRFVSLHMLVPGNWTVQRGHQLLEHIESDMHRAIPNLTVFMHLESLEDPSSWEDMTLNRGVTDTANPLDNHSYPHVEEKEENPK
jgi:cation diffusion facilitator family transporter